MEDNSLHRQRRRSFDDVSFESSHSQAERPSRYSAVSRNEDRSLPATQYHDQLDHPTIPYASVSSSEYIAVPQANDTPGLVSQDTLVWSSRNLTSKEETPLRPRRFPSFTPNRNFLLSFGWWWETGGLAVAIICIVLIIAILVSMDGKPLETWKLPIQPNSLIAVFSTICRSALAVPIADSLSQLKWIYFDGREARSLNYIQVFDEASRGPWGALVFLSKLRPKSIPLVATLCAATTILLLAFEPFTQQVIEFPSRNTTSLRSTGSTSRSFQFVNFDDSSMLLKGDVVKPLVGVSTRALFQNIPVPLKSNANCSEQECHLPDFTSLAACTTCRSEPWELRTAPNCTFKYGFNSATPYDQFHNTTSFEDWQMYQSFKNRSGNWGIECQQPKPGYPDLYLGFDEGPQSRFEAFGLWRQDHAYPSGAGNRLLGKYPYGYSVKWSMAPPFNDDFGYDNRTALLDYGAWDQTNGFSYCMSQPPNSFISADTLPEGIASWTCARLPNSTYRTVNLSKLDTYPVKGTIDTCQLNFCAQRYENVKIYNNELEIGSTKNLPLRLKDDSFTGNLTVPWPGETTPSGTNKTTPNQNVNLTFVTDDPDTKAQEYIVGFKSRDALFEIINLSGWYDVYATGTHFTEWPKLFSAVATTVTNELIQSRKNPAHEVISGPAWVKETYVRVRWVWFILPLLLTICTALVLLATAIQSRKKAYLYKGSALALLFHGLDGWRQEELRVNEEKNGRVRREGEREMERVAKEQRAILGRNVDGDLKILKAE